MRGEDEKADNPIRVLQVMDKFAMRGAPIHGAAIVLLTWWPAFENTEYPLTICVLRGHEGGIDEFHNIGADVIDLDRHKIDPMTILDLIKIIRRENIRILHLHGYVPFSETEKFRLSCDVLMAPYMRKVSIYGNDDTDTAAWMSPMKVFEYMAARKPIVTSNLPAIREVLTHEKDSILCDPDHVDEWEAALVRLQQDTAFSERIATRAYETFLSSYTWEARAERVLASLESPS